MKRDNSFASLATIAQMSFKLDPGSFLDKHKSLYRLYIAFAVIYSLLFIFLLFITMAVIKKAGTQDKTVICMLICLQMSALCKYLNILNY